jgi:hypothetical protein
MYYYFFLKQTSLNYFCLNSVLDIIVSFHFFKKNSTCLSTVSPHPTSLSPRSNLSHQWLLLVPTFDPTTFACTSQFAPVFPVLNPQEYHCSPTGYCRNEHFLINMLDQTQTSPLNSHPTSPEPDHNSNHWTLVNYLYWPLHQNCHLPTQSQRSSYSHPSFDAYIYVFWFRPLFPCPTSTIQQYQ